MKKTVIGLAAALSLAFAASAFAAEGTQPSTGTPPDFEQMKAYRLQKIDDRMNSLQKEKVCVKAAKSQDDLRACRSKHKTEMKEHRGKMKKGGGPSVPGSQTPPQSQ